MLEGTILKDALLGSKNLFFHDALKERPHPILRSGLHATAAVNIRRFFEETDYVKAAAKTIKKMLNRHKTLQMRSQYYTFVGSGSSSVTISYEVAKLYGGRHVFTDKGPDGTQICRSDFRDGERILLVEDVETRGTSSKETIAAILQKNPNVEIKKSIACVVAWHDPLELLPEYEVLPLLDLSGHMNTMEEGECTLCKLGSKAIPLKEPGNWAKFIKDY